MIVDVLIEIPQGSRNKYEYDHRRQRLVLDRVLYASVHYPTDYGFIPDTLSEDGDPVDVLVVVHEPTFPGCLVRARPIGVLEMADEKGPDEKILAVPVADPRFDQITRLEHLAPHWLVEIENFFRTYKTLEGKTSEVLGWEGVERAEEMIRQGFERAAGQRR